MGIGPSGVISEGVQCKNQILHETIIRTFNDQLSPTGVFAKLLNYQVRSCSFDDANGWCLVHESAESELIGFCRLRILPLSRQTETAT